MGLDALEQVPKCAQVVDQLFSLGTDFVPDGVELFADDDVEGLEVGVFDVQVVEVELLKS